jgi:hypothetical protein
MEFIIFVKKSFIFHFSQMKCYPLNLHFHVQGLSQLHLHYPYLLRSIQSEFIDAISNEVSLRDHLIRIIFADLG